jgi:cytochrome P450
MDNVWGTARQMVDERRSKGDKRECMIDLKLDEYNKNGWPLSQHGFNNLFGELMEAGTDTTANQILTLILALAKNPEIQEKARKEIDAVCGDERAPLFSDFDKLPYVNCIIKEGLRWRPTLVFLHTLYTDFDMLFAYQWICICRSDLGLPHTVTKGETQVMYRMKEPSANMSLR